MRTNPSPNNEDLNEIMVKRKHQIFRNLNAHSGGRPIIASAVEAVISKQQRNGQFSLVTPQKLSIFTSGNFTTTKRRSEDDSHRGQDTKRGSEVQQSAKKDENLTLLSNFKIQPFAPKPRPDRNAAVSSVSTSPMKQPDVQWRQLAP